MVERELGGTTSARYSLLDTRLSAVFRSINDDWVVKKMKKLLTIDWKVSVRAVKKIDSLT